MNASLSYKNIWSIALPIIISGVAQNMVTVVDTLYLSKVGKIELGAAGNAGILYFLIATVGLGFTTGAQIIIARRNGEQNFVKIGNIIKHCFYFMLPFAFIMWGVFQFTLPYFITFISKSYLIAEASISFMNYRSYGVLFAFINFIFIAFFVGTKQTKILLYSTLMMSFTNVILDYGLVFGNLGLPNMGLQGAALASIISEGVTTLYFIIYTSNKVDLNKYGLNFKHKFDRLIFGRILNISSPIMLQNFITLGGWFIFFSIIEQMGEDELAISHIIRSIYMVLMIPLFGFSAATNSLVSNLIGEGLQDKVIKLTGRIVILTVGCTLALMFFAFVFPKEIISFYDVPTELLTDTYATLGVIRYSVIMFAITFIIFNAVTGTGNTRISLIIESINIFIYLTFAYVIVTYFSPTVDQVWYTEFVYFFFLGVMSFLYLKFGNWKTKKSVI